MHFEVRPEQPRVASGRHRRTRGAPMATPRRPWGRLPQGWPRGRGQRWPWGLPPAPAPAHEPGPTPSPGAPRDRPGCHGGAPGAARCAPGPYRGNLEVPRGAPGCTGVHRARGRTVMARSSVDLRFTCSFAPTGPTKATECTYVTPKGNHPSLQEYALKSAHHLLNSQKNHWENARHHAS